MQFFYLQPQDSRFDEWEINEWKIYEHSKILHSQNKPIKPWAL